MYGDLLLSAVADWEKGEEGEERREGDQQRMLTEGKEAVR